MLPSFTGRLSPAQLTACRSGSIGILFALLAVPVVGITGAAIDYGMALRTQSKIQYAAEAATFAALSKIPLGADEVAKTLRAHFAANVPERFRNIPLPYTMDDDPPRVSLRIETEVPTTILAILGFEAMPVKVESEAQLPELPKTIKIPSLEQDDGAGSPGGPPVEQLPPEAIAQAQRRLRDFGIELSPEQIQQMAEQAMRQMQRGNGRF
jgi:hypothetical protein